MQVHVCMFMSMTVRQRKLAFQGSSIQIERLRVTNTTSVPVVFSPILDNQTSHTHDWMRKTWPCKALLKLKLPVTSTLKDRVSIGYDRFLILKVFLRICWFTFVRSCCMSLGSEQVNRVPLSWWNHTRSVFFRRINRLKQVRGMFFLQQFA